MHALVEGSAPEAAALARLLTDEGHTVAIATSDADFDGSFDIAYFDVWTPETAPRVVRLRERGTRLSCLSDLILERASIPTIGVTGTAGKSTTSAFVVQLLRAAGIPVIASTTARSENLWATDESLAALDASTGVHVVELTSSHLAFMGRSPHVAVVTSFWPDHLELHGSLAAYRSAKEQIVRHQRPGDHVVVDGAPEVAAFADVTPARRWVVGSPEVERGAFVVDGRLIVRADGDTDVGPAPGGTRTRATLAALAAAAAYGVPAASLRDAVPALEPPSHRAAQVGTRGATALVDDSMAATPAKTAALLRAYAPGPVVLVAGGSLEAAGVAVHASQEEEALLDDTLARAAEVASLVVAFGAAGERIARGVARHGGSVEQVATLDEAIARALELSSVVGAVIVSPMFPLSLPERASVASLLTRASA